MSLQAPGASQNPKIENRGYFYFVTLALWKTKKQAGGWSGVGPRSSSIKGV